MLVFVPNDEPLEIWRLTLRNRTRRTRRLRLFTYLEWCLGTAPDWHREFHKSFIHTEYDPEAGALFATKRLWEARADRGHWNTEWPFTAFHSASLKPTSFDGDKESFLGLYGSGRLPASVKRGTLKRKTGNGLDPIASLEVRITLKPQEEKVITFLVGAAESKAQATEFILKYRSLAEVDRALQEVQRRWEVLLTTVEVSTPDEAMNLLENIWLKYQAISGRLWGRTAYYQTGGAYGFRDQLQDSQIFLPVDPERTKQQILLHARHQFKDGTVYHWWHPISERGLHSQVSDNLLWLPFVVNSYLLETNDFSILSLAEPFVDDPAGAPLYEHCTRAIDKALERFSERGLPLIGAGDWNDGLSAVGLDGKGESIWLGHFLHRILIDFSEIARRCGDEATAECYGARAQRLKAAINELGWDGQWYYRATKDNGEKLGGQENSEGRIFLNAQTWAVIAGVADPERATQVMNVVEQFLEFKAGPVLLYPSYKTPDKDIGYLTRYGPGMRENGGVYTHAATWAVMAEALLGRGDSAFRIFSKVNPIYRGLNPDEYCAEPYVTSGNIEGPESPFYGRGGWTWYTGSAAWLFKVGLESILGIRPTFEGLVVDPCIPAAWENFKVRRTFRGARYDIQVKNPEHLQSGVSRIVIDGEPYCVPGDGNKKILPLFPAGSVHQVVVTLGRTDG